LSHIFGCVLSFASAGSCFRRTFLLQEKAPLCFTKVAKQKNLFIFSRASYSYIRREAWCLKKVTSLAYASLDLLGDPNLTFLANSNHMTAKCCTQDLISSGLEDTSCSLVKKVHPHSRFRMFSPLSHYSAIPKISHCQLPLAVLMNSASSEYSGNFTSQKVA